MFNQNEWSYCKDRLSCGTCKITGKVCPHITDDITNKLPVIPNCYQDKELWSWVPQACRKCPSHPMNGGSGLCSCSLAYPETTATARTVTSDNISITNTGDSLSSITRDNSETPFTYTTDTTSGNNVSLLEDMK